MSNEYLLPMMFAIAKDTDGQVYAIKKVEEGLFQSVVPEHQANKGFGSLHASAQEAMEYLKNLMNRDGIMMLEKTLFIEAVCQTDSDGPVFAKIVFGPELVINICDLVRVCQLYSLNSVIQDNSLAEWDGADDYRIVDDALSVQQNGFYWTARAKYSDFTIETRVMDIPTLVSLLESDEPVVYYHTDSASTGYPGGDWAEMTDRLNGLDQNEREQEVARD